jgi:hypothetical protein
LPAPLNLALVSVPRALSELCVESFSDSSTVYRRPADNPFRITSFADPHPLTPIESNLYKNHRGQGCSIQESSPIFFHRAPKPCHPERSGICLSLSLFLYLVIPTSQNLKGNSNAR